MFVLEHSIFSLHFYTGGPLLPPTLFPCAKCNLETRDISYSPGLTFSPTIAPPLHSWEGFFSDQSYLLSS